MQHALTRLPALAGLLTLGVAGVAQQAGAVASVTRQALHSTGTVRVVKLSVGRALVDANGKTLYAFAPDARKTPTCTGACAQFWPPLLVRHHPVAGRGTRSALLGTVRTKSGRLQVTYDGWPLYTYVEDTAAGQVRGQGLDTFGGKWSTIGATGATLFTSSSKSSGSGGYGGYSVASNSGSGSGGGASGPGW